MKREIKFVPRPMKNGTESSLELWFQVIGDLGVVEFQLATNWYTDGIVNMRLEELRKDMIRGKEDFLIKHFYLEPQPFDICYFSPIRKSDDDSFWENGSYHHAPHIVPCYYGYKYKEEENGSWTTNFVYDKFLREGDDGVWKYLEDYYVEVFGELR